MTIKFNDTWPLKALQEASVKLDALFEAASESERAPIKAQQQYVRALIETKGPRQRPDNTVVHVRKLAGLTERFDDDEHDRFADPDSAFGASGRKDIDPDKIVAGAEDGVTKFPGVRPPHVGSGKGPAPKPAMSRRQAAKNIDPEIARQLAGEDGDDADDEALAAQTAAPAGDAGSVADAPLDGAAPVLDPSAAAAAPTNAMARGEKAKKAAEYLILNKGASRGEFMKFAARELGMSGAYANTFFYALKKRLTGKTPPEAAATADAAVAPDAPPMETWTVRNDKNLALADGSGYDIPVWTPYDRESAFEPKIFENERYAQKAVEAIQKYGFHKVKVIKETF
jgi:hypothetical protein